MFEHRLISAINEWTSEDVRSVDTAALGDELVVLHRAIARLEAESVRRLAEFDRRGGAQAEALPTTAWLRRHCHLNPGAANARVGVARRLDRLPLTTAAFADGDLGLDHVRAIALTRTEAAQAAVEAVEDAVVAYAIQATPRQTAQLVTHVVHAAAPDVVAQDAETFYQQRWVAVSETFEGAYAIDGLLDPESGATLRTALHALMAADRQPGDERSASQARADALVALARHALDRGELAETGGERPHITVLVDLPTLEARSGARAADLGWAGAIPGETARRLACDARVSRIITDGASQPLDVGRATRVVPPAIRKALEFRDGGCVWPGCDRPPPWTDAHHIEHWAEGGMTSLDNTVLLCRRHHRAVHEGRAPCPRPTSRPPPTGVTTSMRSDRAQPCVGSVVVGR